MIPIGTQSRALLGRVPTQLLISDDKSNVEHQEETKRPHHGNGIVGPDGGEPLGTMEQDIEPVGPDCQPGDEQGKATEDHQRRSELRTVVRTYPERPVDPHLLGKHRVGDAAQDRTEHYDTETAQYEEPATAATGTAGSGMLVGRYSF